jgi:hypothetical protein
MPVYLSRKERSQVNAFSTFPVIPPHSYKALSWRNQRKKLK